MVEGQTGGESKATEIVSMEEYNQLKEKVEELSRSKDRILNESKEYKSKWQEARVQVEERERKELEAQENWKALLEKERNDKFEIESRFKNIRKEALKKEIGFEVAKYATDAYNIDDVVSAAVSTGIVQVDEESLSVSGLKEAIDKIREEKFYLFKKNESPKMMNAMPKGEPQIKKASKEEAFDAALKTLFRK